MFLPWFLLPLPAHSHPIPRKLIIDSRIYPVRFTTWSKSAFYHKLILILIITESIFERLIPQAPRLSNQDQLATQAAVIGSAIPIGFAAVNCLMGDCDLSIQPHIGANIDPETGEISPAVSAHFQVGNDNLVNPTFNFGAQFDDDSDLPLPVAPVVGSGINIGDQSSGAPTANVGSNFAFSNGDVHSQFGGNFGLGALNIGNPFELFGR